MGFPKEAFENRSVLKLGPSYFRSPHQPCDRLSSFNDLVVFLSKYPAQKRTMARTKALTAEVSDSRKSAVELQDDFIDLLLTKFLHLLDECEKLRAELNAATTQVPLTDDFVLFLPSSLRL